MTIRVYCAMTGWVNHIQDSGKAQLQQERRVMYSVTPVISINGSGCD
jgi:hypothetical protein